MQAVVDDDKLELLLAETACLRLIHRYGRAIDWQDGAELSALFWPDARVDLGFFSGDAAGAVAFLLDNAALSDRRFHLTANSVLHVAGERADADSCAITQAVGTGADGETFQQLFFGRYLDRFERRADEWRFAERRYLLHGHQAGPLVESLLLAGVARAEGLNPGHPLFRSR